MDFSTIYYPLRESVTMEDYVVATYMAKIPANKNALDYAVEVAIDQSTGTWVPVPAETDEVKRKHRGRVIKVNELPQLEKASEFKAVIFDIAFPYANFGNSISMLLSTVIGNNSSMGWIKLVDLSFPKKYLEGFQGPKFGIDGIRKLLGVPKRPLLTNMIKPCTGIPPKTGAQLAYEASLGGSDFIKDDELLANAEFSTLKERTKLFMEKLHEADSKKGEATIYLLNITDRPDKMLKNALQAVEDGVNGLMINFPATGFDAVRMVTEHKDIQVPVLGHCAMSGVYSTDPWTGIDINLVVGKIARLIGLDISLIYLPGGRFSLTEDDYITTANMLRDDLFRIKPAFPMPGGSVHPGVVRAVTEMSGFETVISAGGAIHGHPMGATSGAKAMRQAIDLAMLNPEEAAKQADKYPEFQAAIQKWGGKG